MGDHDVEVGRGRTARTGRVGRAAAARGAGRAILYSFGGPGRPQNRSAPLGKAFGEITGAWVVRGPFYDAAGGKRFVLRLASAMPATTQASATPCAGVGRSPRNTMP